MLSCSVSPSTLSFTVALQFGAGSATGTVGSDLLCSHIPQTADTHTEAKEWVSRTMLCVCVCLGFSFILIRNPTGDLISCRIQAMDDCTAGRVFNGEFSLGFVTGSRKKKLNYSACIHVHTLWHAVQRASQVYRHIPHQPTQYHIYILAKANALRHLNPWCESTSKPTFTAASPLCPALATVRCIDLQKNFPWGVCNKMPFGYNGGARNTKPINDKGRNVSSSHSPSWHCLFFCDSITCWTVSPLHCPACGHWLNTTCLDKSCMRGNVTALNHQHLP